MAFCQVKRPESNDLYIDKREACDCLQKKLELGHWLGKNPGLKRKGFSTNFDPDSGMGVALKLAHSIEDTLTHSLLAGNKRSALKAFSDTNFETPAIAIFSNGWPKDSDYFEWAKGYSLNAVHTAKVLGIDKTKVTTELLDEENSTRATLVNNITGLRSLELLSDKFKEDVPTRDTILAIARLFLSNLRSFIIDWMEAKLNIRKAILHNQDTQAARVLLMSSMWCPTIFTEDSLKESIESKNSPSLRVLLNLNQDGSYNLPSYSNNKGRQNSHNHSKNRYEEKLHNKRHHNRREIYNKYINKGPFRPQEKDTNTNHQPKPQSTKSNTHKGKNFKGKGKKGDNHGK